MQIDTSKKCQNHSMRSPYILMLNCSDLCLGHLQTFCIRQGHTMVNRITDNFKMLLPSLPIIPFAFLMITIPFYDPICVPLQRKFTGIAAHWSGIILSSISMAVAAIIEVKRKGVARDHNMLDALPLKQPLPISILWHSFQYFVFGIADMFTYEGLFEFLHSEAPKGLKSTSTCFMALGYFLSSISVKIVNHQEYYCK